MSLKGSYLYESVRGSGLGMASPPRFEASRELKPEATFMNLSVGAGSTWLRHLASGLRMNLNQKLPL